MKHFLLLCLFAFLCAPMAWAEDTVAADTPDTNLLQDPLPGTDVRWFIWGVPPDDVVKYEKVVLFDQVDDALMFVDDINGIKTLISYEFYQNRLWRVTYDFLKDDYPNPQHVIDDYVSMEIMLNKRYGEPKSRETLWQDDYYKDKHNRWGLAVYNGKLQLRMNWETPRTDAQLSLKAEKYDYIFRIVHTSRAIAAEMAEAQRQADLAPPPALKKIP